MCKEEYAYLQSMRANCVGKCKGVDLTWQKEQEQENARLERREERLYGLNYDLKLNLMVMRSS